MPIDIETFDGTGGEGLSEPTNGERIVQLLLTERDKAFRAAEIADRTAVKRNSVGTVLRRLESRGLVRHKGDYWALGDEEAVRAAYDFHRTLEALDGRFGREDLQEWQQHAAEDDPQ